LLEIVRSTLRTKVEGRKQRVAPNATMADRDRWSAAEQHAAGS